jgi:hypothetical protein
MLAFDFSAKNQILQMVNSARNLHSNGFSAEKNLRINDPRIDGATGNTDIHDVVFDEPGGVDIQGNLRRRVDGEQDQSPYR